jgi:hypothetical protein
MKLPRTGPEVHPLARWRPARLPPRAVSRGATPMRARTGRPLPAIGADVHYFQDRSGNWAEDLPEWDDLDDWSRRWYVAAVPSPLPEVIDGNLRDVRAAPADTRSTMAASVPGDDAVEGSGRSATCTNRFRREVELPDPNPNCTPSAEPRALPDGRRCSAHSCNTRPTPATTWCRNWSWLRLATSMTRRTCSERGSGQHPPASVGRDRAHR